MIKTRIGVKRKEEIQAMSNCSLSVVVEPFMSRMMSVDVTTTKDRRFHAILSIGRSTGDAVSWNIGPMKGEHSRVEISREISAGIFQLYQDMVHLDARSLWNKWAHRIYRNSAPPLLSFGAHTIDPLPHSLPLHACAANNNRCRCFRAFMYTVPHVHGWQKSPPSSLLISQLFFPRSPLLSRNSTAYLLFSLIPPNFTKKFVLDARDESHITCSSSSAIAVHIIRIYLESYDDSIWNLRQFWRAFTHALPAKEIPKYISFTK
jgi:hypothetical protein